MTNTRRRALIAMILCLSAVLHGCASHAADLQPTPLSGATRAPRDSSPALPTDVVGAAHFDGGYFQTGSGPVIVELYVDPMCPYCRAFEHDNLAILDKEADHGAITLRIHPIAILNRLSSGTGYSTRASAAAMAVAAHAPNKALVFLSLLFDRQPSEGSRGMSDQDLAALQRSIGLHRAAAGPALTAWVNVHTVAATAEVPAETPDGAAVDQVPTVFVAGERYSGASTDLNAFREFLRTHL